NTLLLFALLLKLTARFPSSTLHPLSSNLWLCAFVAALFALHPLRVESVAWICERKDVLSGFFFMLTLWAYVRYAEESGLERSRSRRFYALTLLFFALGLMSKPMLVTVPFVLLLLDYWPLKRVKSESESGEWRVKSVSLILEKIPFLLLAAALSVATVFV